MSSVAFASQSTGLPRLLSRIDPAVAKILEASLEGREVGFEDGLCLATTAGEELDALVLAADEVRRFHADVIFRCLPNW